jgi:hypothetical protein
MEEGFQDTRREKRRLGVDSGVKAPTELMGRDRGDVVHWLGGVCPIWVAFAGEVIFLLGHVRKCVNTFALHMIWSDLRPWAHAGIARGSGNGDLHGKNHNGRTATH